MPLTAAFARKAIETPSILLIGGGHAHVSLLRALARRTLPGAAVTLVTPHPASLYSGLLPAVLRRDCEAGAAEIALGPPAARAGVSLVIGTVAALDPRARVALLRDGRVLGFDLASLDPGGVSATEPGQIAAKPIAALIGAIEAIESGPPGPVAIAGGGPAAVELALALAQRWRGQRRVRLPTADLLPDAPPRARDALSRALAAAGVLRGTGPAVATIAAGRTLGPAWLARSGLACDDSGCVRTDAARRAISHPWFLAAGDAATIDGAPRPKGGVWAVRAGPVLRATLMALLGGREPRPAAPPGRALTIVGLGDGRAVGWRGGLCVTGRLPYRWKQHLDTRWTG